MGLQARKPRIMSIFSAAASWIGGFFDKKYWSPLGSGRKTKSLEHVDEYTALNYSACWCATRLLCGVGASLPLPVYVGKSDDTRAKDKTHPVYKLLNIAPNPEMTAYNFRSLMWQWQINHGNAYAEIEREGNDPDGQVVYLWPLHPDRVEPCRDKETDALYYKVRGENGGAVVELEPWQMLHIPSIITADGICGYGVVAHARETIGAGIAQEKAGGHALGGGNMPRMVVEHSGRWDDDARQAFRDEFEELYSGADGHKVAVLQGDAKLKPLSLSSVDAQFLESRQFNIEEIARWYGVPPHLLHHLLRATFNNIEELGINFVQYSLVPWLEIWEQCIAHKLLTEEERDDYFAEHNVDALLRGDAETRGALYQALVNIGVMTRNEARKLENMDPVPGGDTFLVQGAMVPLDDDGKPTSAFSGNAGNVSGSMPPDDSPDSNEPDDTALHASILRSVSSRLNRVLSNDLSRILTKETKTVVNLAKKPNDFVSSVDSFYNEHAIFINDATSNTLAAITECGAVVKSEVFVADWIRDGKTAMLEAAGTATTGDDLVAAVNRVIESRSWTERPQIASERVQNAAASV